MDRPFIICSACTHYEPITELANYDSDSSCIRLRKSLKYKPGKVDRRTVSCRQGHRIAELLTAEEAVIHFDRVRLYRPCDQVGPLWKEKPASHRLSEQEVEEMETVERMKKNLE